MLTRKDDYLIAIRCDCESCCYEETLISSDPIEAIKEARDSGWSAVLGGDHICPKCVQREGKNEQ